MDIDQILADAHRTFDEKLKAALEYGCPVCGAVEFGEIAREVNEYFVSLDDMGDDLTYELQHDLEAEPLQITCYATGCGFVIWDEDGWWTARSDSEENPL
jgi:hypothetical protein